ncbi:MAG TPA: phosphatidate cytidylyltransferase [Lachnospiraceae bacterium]|nr:phosphatidate cytidylyltransferase [Lachnospiraceae bacterium]
MFLTRILSSFVLVIITLATILKGGLLLELILLIISLIAFIELTKATKVHTIGKFLNGLEIVGCLGIVAYYGVIRCSMDWKYIVMVIILTMMMHMLVYVFSFPKYSAYYVMSALFTFIYAPIMLSYIFFTRNLENGIYLVWMIFISSWGSDTCAYLVGSTMGKHKLAPKLSPKKSIEGSIGGIVGSALLSGIFGLYLVENAIISMNIIWIFVIIGAVGSLISQLGDLAASAIKRNNDIKDYGKLIPGHGGIMDRFDSVIFTAPIIYYLALFFIK